MDSSNNNFKSFDDQNSDLPEGFGWDDMKEGVYAKMPPKKKRRLAIWWWLGGASALLLALSTWMFHDSSKTVDPITVLAEADSISREVLKTEVINSEDASQVASDDPLYTTKLSASSVEKKNSNVNNVEEVNTKSTDRLLSSRSTTRNILEKNTPSLSSLEGDAGFVSNERIDNSLGDFQSNLSPTETKERVSSEVFLSSEAIDENLKENFASNQFEVLTLIHTNLLKLLALDEPVISYTLPEVRTSSASDSDHKESYLSMEGLVTIPASMSSSINTAYTSPWYGAGISVGYQKQLGKRFGVSAHYTFKQVVEEFAFTKRDTITGTERMDFNVNYIDINSLTLLTTSTRPGVQEFDRFRDVLSYNRLNVHQLSLFAHYNQTIGRLSSLDIGLGGGIQYLHSARGFRLDNDGELVDLTSDLSTFRRMSGTLDGRMRYMFQLSPKLNLTAGVNYSYALPQNLSNGLGNGLPSVMSGRVGLRWKL